MPCNPSATDIVIVAAGSGSRVADGDPTPKQFRLINGEPVLRRTTRIFTQRGFASIVVVVANDRTDEARKALGPLAASVDVVTGGSDRRTSTLNGLHACDAPFVMVHDAARPFADGALLDRLLSAADETAGVVPALPIGDTVKEVAGDSVTGTLDRNGLRRVQTPQLFARTLLLAAHEAAARAKGREFTDDASIVEWHGGAVRTVDGDEGNIKLTTAEDFRRVKGRSVAEIADIRVGHGYDTHRTCDGDAVTICGVSIAAPFRLDGHSDADIGLHALTDALLGTCGEGDIGSHFPPSDPQWAGASSDRFLLHAGDLVARRGGTVTNVDVTIVCEAPKIGPHRAAMRERLADLLGLEPDRVSVKATTNERIGFVGRNEGLAALATATVRYVS